MATVNLHGNERLRTQITPMLEDIFIDIENRENESIATMFHSMHVFQVRKKEYGIKVFVFESDEQIKDFDFKDFADAEILYTNIP